jgi:AraC-like DNA-binding protein
MRTAVDPPGVVEPIPRLGFNPPCPRVPGFEMADLPDFRGRMRQDPLRGVHRLDFHTLTLITGGSGEHMIDFRSYACRRGTLLWVRPGQVQRYGAAGVADGRHLLFTAAFPAHTSGGDRLVGEWYGRSCWQLGSGPDYGLIRGLLEQTRAEYVRAAPSAQILQLLLAAVILQIDRLPGTEEGDDDARAGGEVYARFRAELERGFTRTRKAEGYAQRLGYTLRTLTRACLAATGQSAKHVIDARIALEAQRLLAHTDEPVAAIARQLGFSEPTNFVKFFTRHAGVTPGDFRRRYVSV